MTVISSPKRLVDVGLYRLAAKDVQGLVDWSEEQYRKQLEKAADEICSSGAKIVMLTGPSASGKTTTAHRLADTLTKRGITAQVVSLDNFFLGTEHYPILPDGTKDYESPQTLDMPLINRCLKELCETGQTVLPVYDFLREKRSEETEFICLRGGVCIVEGLHALNPALTGLVPQEAVYRVYAGIREEYCRDGHRTICTRDIRLCRRVLRDAVTRGHNPERTLAMWGRVLSAEERYIKAFKHTANLLLDTSFPYELGIIAQMFRTGKAELSPHSPYWEEWAETKGRFEGISPVSLSYLPKDSMLREFYGDGRN